MESNLAVAATTREELEADQKGDPLLVAALAALLVDYGRYISQRDIHEELNTQANWRMMGRWEQLRGKA
jgi:hypothetical protein